MSSFYSGFHILILLLILKVVNAFVTQQTRWINYYIPSAVSTKSNLGSSNNFQQNFKDAKSDGFGTRARNAAVNVTTGDIIIPLCSNLEMRQSLANKGIYAGVEYRVCRICLKDGETEVSSLKGLNSMDKYGAVAFVQPAYPLRDYLERSDW